MNEPSVRTLTEPFSGCRLDYPMVLFSGTTLPAEVAAKWMPLGVGISLLKTVSMGCYDKIVIPVVTLATVAVVCGTGAA